MPQDKKNQPPDFEKSLAELEKIVQRMERGEQSLEHTLKDFERGMVLSEQCRKSLESAQQRVEKLVKTHDGYKLKPLEDADPDGDSDDDPDHQSDG